MRTVLQSTETECGLAALSTLMSHYGYETNIQEMRQYAAPGRSGLNLAQMRSIATRQGFDVKLFGVNSSALLSDFPVPAIAFWENSHYVVIRRIRRGKIEIIDPAVGEIVIDAEEFTTSFSGVLMTVNPGEEFKRRRTKQGGLLPFVVKYLPRNTSWMFGLPILVGLVSMLALLPALTTQAVVDHLVPYGLENAVLPLALLFVGVALFHFLLVLARSEMVLWLEKSIDVAMMLRMFRHLLKLPFSYFMNRSSGDLLVRFSSASTIRDAVSGRLFPLFMDGILLLFYGMVLASYHVFYLFAVLALLFIFGGIVLFTLGLSKRLADKELQKMAESQSILLESIEGIETIKSLGLETESQERYEARYLESVRWSIQRERLENVLYAVFQAFSLFVPLVLLCMGVFLFSMGEMTIGQLLAAGTLAGTAIGPVQNIGIALQSLQTVGVHTARLQDITDEAPEAMGGGETIDFQGQVEFVDVTIAYDGEKPVIEGASFSLLAGQTAAIVGPSGAGKSTLAKTILGLLPAKAGTIRYQGFDSTQVDLHSVRSRVGLVTQTVSGISGSLADNIAFGREWITRDDMMEACAMAGLTELLKTLPMGLDTPLGESGKGLSGGQLQRLAIARAVVGRPSLLVLDEATSHLDEQTERDVTERLNKLDMTKVVIAHRLSTIKNADVVFRLDDAGGGLSTMSVLEYLALHDEAAEDDAISVLADGHFDALEPETETSAFRESSGIHIASKGD